MASNNMPPERTKAADILSSSVCLHQLRNRIEGELIGTTFNAQDNMIDSLFPVDQIVVEEMYSSMVKDGWYIETGTSSSANGTRPRPGYWKDIPKKAELVHDLYPGFVKVANAIADRCPTAQLSVHWVDSHMKSHKFSRISINELRPDLTALVLPKGTKGYPVLSSSKKMIPPWWRRVLVALEVDNYGQNQAILQLMSCIRLIFGEQVDRRFALGFTLAIRVLIVHVADRSGVLRSVPIDIHEEPKTFIRIMAGLSLLSPHRLGWDPTMKILKNPEGPFDKLVCEHSWETGVRDSSVSEQFCHETWVVNMPLKDKDAKERRVAFILFESFDLSRAEKICGRGTRIWKAWRMDDMHLPSARRHVYVYKDTWKDDRRQTEGDLFERVGTCEGVAEMVSHEVVHIDGEVDNTLTLVRRNVQQKDEFKDIGTYYERLSHRHTMRYLLYFGMPLVKSVEPMVCMPRGRTHTRLVVKDFGWPLRRFVSLLELVRVFKNAVDGHRNLLDNGVLHRDISPGNIMIVQQSSGSTSEGSEGGHDQDSGSPPKKYSSTRGQLIDLDYSKDIKNGNLTTDEHLSGTLPFISPEIIRNRYIFHQKSDYECGRIPTHGHQHDLESLFWVLCWLALCRGGPDAARELLYSNENTQHEAPDILRNVDSLRREFDDLCEKEDAETLAVTKKIYFSDPIEFSHLLHLFSLYFIPIKPLVQSLFDILYHAHKTRDFSTLHADFRREFEELEKKLEKDPHGFLLQEQPDLLTPAYRNMIREMVEKGIERRKLFWDGWDVNMEGEEETMLDIDTRERKRRKLSAE